MNDIQARLQQMQERTATRKLELKDSQIIDKRDIAPMKILPWVLQLRVSGTSSILNLNAGRQPVVLGRTATNGTSAPDVDLSPFGAFRQGVSRQHASISANRDFVLLTDLNSSNGTFINGMRLPAAQPVPLQHGDVITLGDFKLQMGFNVVPAEAELTLKSGTGKHLLVIENDTSVAAAYRTIFEHCGYRVSVTDTAIEIPLFLAQVTPDIVICDLMVDDLPQHKHMDVVHLLRSEMKTRVPILVVSS
ncbi:MAG: FHA domain-containing protein, partial [Chloroflexota bacterium]